MSDSVKEAVEEYKYGGFVGLIKIGDTTKYVGCEITSKPNKEQLRGIFHNMGIQMGILLDRGDFDD